MRNQQENISIMQKQINDLQIENQILKNILEEAGVHYAHKLASYKMDGECEPYDENQGQRIIHPTEITEKMAINFFSRFWGRQDVYAKRSVNKSTGKVGYYPQCQNFWKPNCCHKRLKTGVPCNKCKYYVYKVLQKEDIIAHLKGSSMYSSTVVGVYPLFKDGTCRFLVFDFDNHGKNAENDDFANKDDDWIEEVDAMRTICKINGIEPLVERSRSGKGAHIWVFFDNKVPASLARKFGMALLDKGAEQVNLKSFKYYDRMLPAQDRLPDGRLGNLIALPLQGDALKNGNSAFVDEKWNAYSNQWETLFNKQKLSQEFLELKIKEWTEENDDEVLEDRDKPWQKRRKFSNSDVKGVARITLSNGIYIDTTNVAVAMQNKIRRLAAISNPIYFKNKAIGTSNYATSRWIYLGKDHSSGYIEIPRGLYDDLTENFLEANIKYNVEDERQKGRTIDVTFKGELRQEQKLALDEIIKYDNGILHAATAFGKTVVCSAIIAEKKVNTLIILESSSLMEQWKESLEEFLEINEELPEYKTKTGRIRIRKSLIGKLQGAHDSMTGIVDIAMAGSICKKGEFHSLLNQYGMVLVDECHHAASDTIANILKEVKAKYVYGVTATPKRSDGLEKINYMLLGPIRYSYTSKEKADAQGIDHFVYPRFTRTVSPRGVMTEKMHPNEAYEIIRENEARDDLIVSDVIDCVKSGRTPVVLSKYKEHTECLYNRLKEKADYVFIMTGNNSKREHKKIVEQLHQVEADKSLILVATGSLIGEGFDFPRLDTLFMATPVSFRGVVEQYAGRLNRDYSGKESVIVYDYVDRHIPMFDSMYAKRLKAYKQIGYEVCAGIEIEKQRANAIFDGDKYLEVFHKDLKEARSNIIISTPTISSEKICELIRIVKNRQIDGVEVTIVTWNPDEYGFGDASYWMALHEEMRQAGFYVKLAEDYCEQYAIIDNEIVWYGNISILSKAEVKERDSVMRIESKEISEELMEFTFGKNPQK